MAEVYEAYHPGLDRYVAIKVLHPFLAEEEDFLTRFQREARIVATFRHPNIVQVYDFDFDSEDGVYYMVMEFIDGPSLKARLQEMARKGEKLPLEEAIRIVIAIANALDYAHRQGMVHRDIKPANIMFTQDGQAILSDFGIARMINTATLTASGAMVGTPAYVAPEQGLGEAGDERADIYSLGVVLYQLTTDCLPFDADTPLGIVLKHINAPLTPPTALNPDLPPDIDAVLMSALAKDPGDRYQTAKEFVDDLEQMVAGKPVEPVRPSPMTAPATADALASLQPQNQVTSWEQPTVQGSTAMPLPQAPPPVSPLPQPAPAARPKRRWMLGIAPILVLLCIVALLIARVPNHILAALLSQMEKPTPGVLDTPTSTPTPDLTATYDTSAAQFVAWLATYEATTGITPTPSPTPSPSPTSTPTPDLTTTAMLACTFDMAIVSDQQVWPSVLIPGQRFTKRWTIKNTGTCTWAEDVELVLVSGTELEVVEKPGIESLSPGGIAEVELTLQAPTVFDRYTSVWQLQDGRGNRIGDKLEITYCVGPTPTPPPTATPTTTPTPELTPVPAEPLWMSEMYMAWCDPSRTRGRIEWSVGGGPSEEYRYFYGRVSAESELPGPYNEFPSFPHVMTYFTTSGTLVFPVPDNCCRGDRGQYVSPEGYEIVWKKVWFTGENCP